MEKQISAADRKKEITSLLEDAGTARVSELSRRFGVTEETIRRDLEWLENEGTLLRTHGGAVLQRKDAYDPPIFFRESIHEDEKRLIAKSAAAMVNEGDIIAVDSGSTCLHMIKHLQNLQVTVMTYSVAVVNELMSKPNIKIILIGGNFDRDSMANVGVAAEKMVEGYHVDKFFFSGRGFDLNRGVSETFESHVLLKRKIISISDHLILLADSSKFEKKSLMQLTDLSEVHQLITDAKMTDHAINEIETKGVEVIISNVESIGLR